MTRQFFTILFLVICAHASEPRTWFLAKGTVFTAQFVGYKKGKVALKNAMGKTVVFRVDQLSLVDRYYLHVEEEIPLSELKGGNISDPECEMQFTSVKKAPPFQLSGDTYKISLSVVKTPHFLLLHESGMKVDEMAKMLEKVWYSHAYRTPGFIDEFGSARMVYIYCEEGEVLTGLGDYYVAHLGESHSYSSRKVTGILQKWNHDSHKVDIPLPTSLVEKYATKKVARIQTQHSKMAYMEGLENGAPFYKWQELYFPAQKLPQHKGSSKKSCVNGLAALVSGSAIRLHGNSALTDVGVNKDSLRFRFPPQGKPRVWGKALITATKNEVLEPSLGVIYGDRFRKSHGVEANLANVQLLMAAGRFLEKDFEHMIARCKLSEYLREHKVFPKKVELSQIYGYPTVEKMEQAFEKFVFKENIKL